MYARYGNMLYVKVVDASCTLICLQLSGSYFNYQEAIFSRALIVW